MTFDIQKFVEDSNSTYMDLLQCNEVSRILTANKEFQAKFLSTQFLIQLFQILSKTNDFAVHRHFISISQALNPILALRFTDNLLITEAAFTILDNKQCQSSYAFGTISRYLLFAVHNYPSEMQEIFDLSTKIYPIMLKNIDKLCLYLFVSDIITDRSFKLDYFLWICFKNLVGEEEAKKMSPVPLCQYLRADNFYLPHNSLTEIHKTNIYKLLTLFFQQNEGTESVFANYVSKYISSQKNIFPIMFNLASSISPTNEITQSAFDTVVHSFENSEYAANYIVKYHKLLSRDNIEYAVYVILTNKKVANQTLHCLPKLVESVAKEGGLKEVEKILAFAWNTNENNDDKNDINNSEILKKNFIIKCAIKIQKKFMVKWPEKFESDVINPWINDNDEINYDFKFDQSLIDSDYIDFLKHLFEVKV